VKGKWRIVRMPDYTSDYPDMVEPAYILFDGKGGGEFAFGCVTGAIHGAGDSDAIAFDWNGNDEMDEASGDGWPSLSRTVPSKAKSASTAVMKPTSLRGPGRLLQQPVRPLHNPFSNGHLSLPRVRGRVASASLHPPLAGEG
jgi:hypothetical protein